MLYLSSLLIEEKQIETFDELLDVIKLRAKMEKYFLGLILSLHFLILLKTGKIKLSLLLVVI